MVFQIPSMICEILTLNLLHTSQVPYLLSEPVAHNSSALSTLWTCYTQLQRPIHSLNLLHTSPAPHPLSEPVIPSILMLLVSFLKDRYNRMLLQDKLAQKSYRLFMHPNITSHMTFACTLDRIPTSPDLNPVTSRDKVSFRCSRQEYVHFIGALWIFIITKKCTDLNYFYVFCLFANVVIL